MRKFYEAFQEAPLFTSIMFVFLMAILGSMFQYTLYTFTGRDINFMYDVSIATMMTVCMRIYCDNKEEIAVGGFIIEWGWMIAFIIRTFFEVKLPLWTI